MSTVSASTVMVATANNCASVLVLVACVAAVTGGSRSSLSNRSWSSGGDGFDVDFVLWLRRRGDACSGVDAEPRSLYRSVELAARCPVPLACPRSSSFSGAGEGDDVSNLVFLRSAGPRPCWFKETKVDDFPYAMNPSAGNRVSLAPCGSGGGGAKARPRLAAVVFVDRVPRDCSVISFSCEVLCNTSWSR